MIAHNIHSCKTNIKGKRRRISPPGKYICTKSMASTMLQSTAKKKKNQQCLLLPLPPEFQDYCRHNSPHRQERQIKYQPMYCKPNDFHPQYMNAFQNSITRKQL